VFPFVIQGFRSDIDSKRIYYRALPRCFKNCSLNLLNPDPDKLNDNALVESKNGSAIRKRFGYTHISQRFAHLINEFNRSTLFLYMNYHRPCFFPKTTIDIKGEDKKFYLYECMMTLPRPSDSLYLLGYTGNHNVRHLFFYLITASIFFTRPSFLYDFICTMPCKHLKVFPCNANNNMSLSSILSRCTVSVFFSTLDGVRLTKYQIKT